MDEKFNEMPVSIIHFDEDGTASNVEDYNLDKVEEVPIFEPLNSGFRNGSMTNSEPRKIKIQVGKAVSILVTLKNDPIVRNHGQSIAKKYS